MRALLGVHVVSRVTLAALAVGGLYPFRSAGTILGDVNLYARYAAAMLAGRAPYTDLPIEYPPGALPAILLPGLGGGGLLGYRLAFVAMCLAVDAAVLATLLVLARRGDAGVGGRGDAGPAGAARRGDAGPAGARPGGGRFSAAPGARPAGSWSRAAAASSWGDLGGAWCWVVGLILIGPLAVTRLDLVPALATVLAVERGLAGRWGPAGAWLGLGAAVKFYPGLLVLPAMAAAWRGRDRRAAVAVAGGAAAAGLAGAALAGPGLVTMLRTVVGYHLERGLQVESLWATPLLVASRLGADVGIAYTFRAYHVEGGAGAVAEQLATLGAVAALAAGVWLTVRAARHHPRTGLAEGLFASLLLLLATGSVLSPQYLVWALALAATALAAGTRALRGPAWAVLPLCLLTQAIYPVLYDQVTGLTWPGIALLATRNALLGAVAVWSAVALWRSTRPAPADPPPAADRARPADAREPLAGSGSPTA